MNIERIYTTSTSAETVAEVLAEHFRTQGFEAQVFGTTENRVVMQARKDSLWRQALGVAYAITVIIARKEGQLLVDLGEHEWVDTAVSAGIGLVAVPPVLLGTAYGIWKEHQLDSEVWRVVDQELVATHSAPVPTPL